nr:aminopeptidase [Parachlamydiaceae bacterium]
SMETMRCDMGGAAAVLGTIQVIAALGLKVNVVGVIPSAENSIAANSYKPGDVYLSYAGKSVEIGNTDAEGRLILADAIAYTIKMYEPTQLIDIATLTGAIHIALGPESTGLFSNNDALAGALEKAGTDSFERVWRMPLIREYRDTLKSDIADIKNHGVRGGSAIIAALFIEEFVGKLPWAHLDIASTAFYDEGRRYHPKLGTGIGVRLLVSYLSAMA